MWWWWSGNPAVTEAAEGGTTDPVVLAPTGVALDDVEAVARAQRAVVLGAEAVAVLERSYALARALLRGDEAVYGLSTGFGALANRYIEPDQRAALQIGLIRSHAATVGEEVESETVRAM